MRECGGNEWQQVAVFFRIICKQDSLDPLNRTKDAASLIEAKVGMLQVMQMVIWTKRASNVRNAWAGRQSPRWFAAERGERGREVGSVATIATGALEWVVLGGFVWSS